MTTFPILETVDFTPHLSLLIHPVRGGEQLISPEHWKHHAWHVLLMTDEGNMSVVWRRGMAYDGAPPPAHEVLAGIVAEEDTFEAAPTFPEFVDEQYGGADPAAAYTTFEELRRQHEDLVRLLPHHHHHFLETFRED